MAPKGLGDVIDSVYAYLYNSVLILHDALNMSTQAHHLNPNLIIST